MRASSASSFFLGRPTPASDQVRVDGTTANSASTSASTSTSVASLNHHPHSAGLASNSLMRATSRATAAGVWTTRLTSMTPVAGATGGHQVELLGPVDPHSEHGHVLDSILLMAGDVVLMDQSLRDDTVADVRPPRARCRGRRFTTVLEGQASKRSAGNVPDGEGR